MNWFSHISGLDNLSGQWYGFWSGIGGDLSQFAIIAGLISLIRKHNCHVKGCLRIGKFLVAGTTWIVCAKHHPSDPPTAKDIRDLK